MKQKTRFVAGFLLGFLYHFFPNAFSAGKNVVSDAVFNVFRSTGGITEYVQNGLMGFNRVSEVHILKLRVNRVPRGQIMQP